MTKGNSQETRIFTRKYQHLSIWVVVYILCEYYVSQFLLKIIGEQHSKQLKVWKTKWDRQ